MDELLQHIENVFNENKLIGNYDFTEEEYSLMLRYVGELCELNKYFDIKQHNIVFVALVEITKRWKEIDTNEDREENSRFWNFVFKTLTGEEVFNTKLYNAFTSIMSQMDSHNEIPVVRTGKKYYATLMMHAFAPRKSIYSFFDLCYNIFKKDLDFGFTNNDEWLCEIVAEQMKNVLEGGYREDKLVSIGSSAYSIKVGLRSFVLNESLSVEFNRFTKDTFVNINKLFNREIIEEKTRLERCIIDWWKNKTEFEKLSDETVRKRSPTVSKQYITAKYIRNDNEILLCIPSIRLDCNNNIMLLSIYVSEKQVYSKEMRTKRGELVVATKPIDFKLNELLNCSDSITVRVEIQEDNIIIFDSEKSKTTSLNREFILFDSEKEIFSQINKPTNYFIYSLNIDTIEGAQNLENEDRLTTCGANIYNIYPKAGENLKGETKQVFFVDKTKTASLGTNACLIGGMADVEWILDDISCYVYKNAVKLMVPENFNLKALELRIDNKRYKLQELNYERIEWKCYQFGLKVLGLLSEYYPTDISLYSYEKEKTLFSETIIVLPNLDIEFSSPFYYGDIERKITINTKMKTWNSQDNEVMYLYNDGVLVVKVPYLRWRINNNEWRNKPINKKLWYKDFLQNGDLLEIDNPKGNDTITISGKADGKSFEISKNQGGKFEIGRAIYANENKTDIVIRFSDGKNRFDLFNIATKEHFVDNPLIYSNGKVYWNVENAFIGDKDNDFFLIAKANGKNEKSGRKKVGVTNIELGNFDEDFYKIIVKIRDKNIFSKEEKYDAIFEGDLTVGTLEKLRFKNKRIKLLSATCINAKSFEWISFIPKYFIDKLELVKEEENVYYTGQLCVIDQNGETRVLNKMENENGDYDKVNPVRIELRDNSTLWLVAGYEGKNDFIGGLFYDKRRKGICNIAQQNELYDEMNLYRFKEEEYV